MIVRGVEYGLFWSIWAHCRYDDWLVRAGNPSYTSAIIKRAVYANQAYRLAHPTEKSPELTEDFIESLPNSEYAAIKAAVEEQVILDSGITIKAKENEDDAKNAEGSVE